MHSRYEAEERQTSVYRRMTPAEKWHEVQKLRQTAWILKMAGVRALHPDWSEERVEFAVREIFLYAVS